MAGEGLLAAIEGCELRQGVLAAVATLFLRTRRTTHASVLLLVGSIVHVIVAIVVTLDTGALVVGRRAAVLFCVHQSGDSVIDVPFAGLDGTLDGGLVGQEGQRLLDHVNHPWLHVRCLC